MATEKRKGLVSGEKINWKSPFQVDYIKFEICGQEESPLGPPPVLCEAPGPVGRAIPSESDAMVPPFVKQTFAWLTGLVRMNRNIINNIGALKNHFSNFSS